MLQDHSGTTERLAAGEIRLQRDQVEVIDRIFDNPRTNFSHGFVSPQPQFQLVFR